MWWVASTVFWIMACFTWLRVGISIGKNRARSAQAMRGPICGCGHHISYHLHPDSVAARHRNGSYACEDCHCTQYVGPPPSGGDVILGMSQQDQLQLLGLVDNTGE